MNEDFKLKDIYEKYRENKNSHVYLVETNSIDKATEDIKNLIININNLSNNDIKELVYGNSLPTFCIIGPKNQEIVTDDIERLIVMLQKVPVITKENYFVIYNAEKLNKKSGNQMLKVIEEPETEMLGFFVCNSADAIMPTISSRTQLITLNYDVNKVYDEDLVNDVLKYLEEIRDKKTILINKNIIEKYKDSKDIGLFIECLIFYEKKYIDSEKNSDIIIRETKILNKLYELYSKLNINCNSNLLLDKFVIEVSRL